MESSCYREGDAAALVAQLESSRDELAQRVGDLEKELWKTRRKLVVHHAFGSLGVAGIGALVGNIVGGILWAWFDNPAYIIGTVAFGMFFGVILRGIWNKPNDDFPKAIVSGNYVSGGGSL